MLCRFHGGCSAEDPSGESGNGPNELLRAIYILGMVPTRLKSKEELHARRLAYELDTFWPPDGKRKTHTHCATARRHITCFLTAFSRALTCSRPLAGNRDGVQAAQIHWGRRRERPRIRGRAGRSPAPYRSYLPRAKALAQSKTMNSKRVNSYGSTMLFRPRPSALPATSLSSVRSACNGAIGAGLVALCVRAIAQVRQHNCSRRKIAALLATQVS